MPVKRVSISILVNSITHVVCITVGKGILEKGIYAITINTMESYRSIISKYETVVRTVGDPANNFNPSEATMLRT